MSSNIVIEQYHSFISQLAKLQFDLAFIKPPATFTCLHSIDLAAYVLPLFFGQTLSKAPQQKVWKKCQFCKEKCALTGAAGAPAGKTRKCTMRQGETDINKPEKKNRSGSKVSMRGKKWKERQKKIIKREVHKGNSVQPPSLPHYECILGWCWKLSKERIHPSITTLPFIHASSYLIAATQNFS